MFTLPKRKLQRAIIHTDYNLTRDKIQTTRPELTPREQSHATVQYLCTHWDAYIYFKKHGAYNYYHYFYPNLKGYKQWKRP